MPSSADNNPSGLAARNREQAEEAAVGSLRRAAVSRIFWDHRFQLQARTLTIPEFEAAVARAYNTGAHDMAIKKQEEIDDLRVQLANAQAHYDRLVAMSRLVAAHQPATPETPGNPS